eukprot:SAG22_NODE_4765_length_1171_cov_0.755597_2_plen_75_part_01
MDFRTKARAEADRAFDEMTRLAAEEAERVTEEHNRALEVRARVHGFIFWGGREVACERVLAGGCFRRPPVAPLFR